MKKIKIFHYILIIVFLFICGCSTAKKPSPLPKIEKPQMVKDSDIAFCEQSSTNIPVKVKELVDRHKTMLDHVAVLDNNKVYILTMAESDEIYELKKVMQKVINDKETVLEVTFLEKEVKSKDENNMEKNMQLFKLDTNSLGSGVVFNIEEIEEEITKEITTTKDIKDEKKELEKQDENIAGEAFININLPKSQDTITTPLIVKGMANIPTGIIQLRLHDMEGNIIGETMSVVSKDNKAVEFEVKINFNKPEKSIKGRLEIFSVNQKDGSEENMKVIPLIIQ